MMKPRSSRRSTCSTSRAILSMLVGLVVASVACTQTVSASQQGGAMADIGRGGIDARDVQAVTDFEIVTRAETLGGTTAQAETIAPYGRGIRLRFAAFGEYFDVKLSLLEKNGGMLPGARVRALGAGNAVVVDRAQRLCTYEGWLSHGGWMRAVVQSPTSATVHFLHQGEVHFIEPVQGHRGQQSAFAGGSVTQQRASTASPPGRPRRRFADGPDSQSGARTSRGGGKVIDDSTGTLDDERAHAKSRLGVNREKPTVIAFPFAHVAYRYPDLQPLRSREARPQQRPLERVREIVVGRDERKAAEQFLPSSGRGVQTGAGQEGHDRRLAPASVESSTASNSTGSDDVFRMPRMVEAGVGGTWDDGPWGPIESCPSSPKTFEIGLAMDTGFFKTVTGYGTDGVGNSYGEPQLSLEEAIDIAELEVQAMISLVNVLFTDQVRLFVKVKMLEIRTETAAENSDDSLESTWNHEPLDHTLHQGIGRGEYGCPPSRTKGVAESAFASSADHFDTLEGFASWRLALPESARNGMWMLLTACYDEGVQGLTYIGAACSDAMGAGWVSHRPYGTWEVVAHELGHALGASDYLDFTKDVMRMAGRWNDFGLQRQASRNEVCKYMSNHPTCFKAFEATCGDGKLEPGEECDDKSPCCNPDTCKLVPNARCSQGAGWNIDPDEVPGVGTVTGQCCTEDCQFRDSTTLCQVSGSDRKGVCGNGGCRRQHTATVKYWSYEVCVQPEAEGFNPCLNHYKAVSHGWMNSSEAETAPEGGQDDGECLEEQRYPLPVGTVCDDVEYKECDEEGMCKTAPVPARALKRNVTRVARFTEGNSSQSSAVLTSVGATPAMDSNGVDDGARDGTFDIQKRQQDNEAASPISLTYKGCFKDGHLRKNLKGASRVDDDLTAEKCGKWCARRGYSVLGLQNGRRCSCGNDFGGSSYPREEEETCNLGCNGDLSEKCGAFGKNSIYSIITEGPQDSDGSAPGTALSAAPGDQDLGRQGSGVLAGSRIRWPQLGGPSSNRPPEYYDDVESSATIADDTDGLEYLGCYQDHPGRLREFFGEVGPAGADERTRLQLELEDTVYLLPRSLTPQACEQRCRSIGMRYFGLQLGTECRCGDDSPRHAPAANCVFPCAGDRTYVCGGAWANSVYRIRDLDPRRSNASSSEQERPAATHPEATAGAQREWAGPFTFLGCFADGGFRDLNGTTSTSDEQRPQLCGVFCKALGYEFFGVGWSKECSCGQDYGSLGRSPACNYPCAGSPSVNCGGAWANSVYMTSEIVGVSGPETKELATASPTGSPARFLAVSPSGVEAGVEEPTRESRAYAEPAAYSGGSNTMPGRGARAVTTAFVAAGGTGDGGSSVTASANPTAPPRATSVGQLHRLDGEDHQLPIQVSHPLEGEVLTANTVATVRWQRVLAWNSTDADGPEGIDLWVVYADSEEELVGHDIADEGCMLYLNSICDHTFLVPYPLGGVEGEGAIFELRGKVNSYVLGRSHSFSIKAQDMFAFIHPNRDSIPVRGDEMTITWETTGSKHNVWLTLHSADTGASIVIIGLAENTGSLKWVLPRRVQQGIYYLVIQPSNGDRAIEERAVSEVFRVASPSATTSPALALKSPVFMNSFEMHDTVHVSWTSPDIDRIKLTVQNEWEWDVETLIFEGHNDNGFEWEVLPVKPGAGYYLQLVDASERLESGNQGSHLIGGVSEAQFPHVSSGVRSSPFTILPRQPKVTIGNIFKNQPGEVWIKGRPFEVEVSSSMHGDTDRELPVKLELMQGSISAWTLPGSPTAGPVLRGSMPPLEPQDGTYYLRATSLLHPQAFAVSNEFEVTSYVPLEFGGADSHLSFEQTWEGSELQPGRSYEIRWSSSFVGQVSIGIQRTSTDTSGDDLILLDGFHSVPNTGSTWLTVPSPSEEAVQWCSTVPSSSGTTAASSADAGGGDVDGVGEGSAHSVTERGGSDGSGGGEIDLDCCFHLVVSDVHDPTVHDVSGRVCVDLGAHDSRRFRGRGSGMSRANATLTITAYPETPWEMGTAREIRWTSEGVTSTVTVSLVTLEGTRVPPSAPTKRHRSNANDDSERVASSSSHSEDAPPSRLETAGLEAVGGRVRLGAGLPAVGSLTTILDEDLVGAPLADDYHIEVVDDETGIVAAFSRPFHVVNRPSLTFVMDSLDKAVFKGQTCTLQWEAAGDISAVRAQLFQGSSTPVTVEGRTCVPFLADRVRFDRACVADPASSMYRQCATETNEAGVPTKTGFCKAPEEHMKLIWQSEELRAEQRTTDVLIPRKEFELPSVRQSFFWRVVSVDDPYVHAKSPHFSLVYPTTFLTFHTTGLAHGDIARHGGTAFTAALEASLTLESGRLILWAVDGDHFQADDENAIGAQRNTGNNPTDVTTRDPPDASGVEEAQRPEGARGQGKRRTQEGVPDKDRLEASRRRDQPGEVDVSDDAHVRQGQTPESDSGFEPPPQLDITMKVFPATSARQLSPEQIMGLLGLLCEQDAFALGGSSGIGHIGLGQVTCGSVSVKEASPSSYHAAYSSVLSRTREGGHGLFEGRLLTVAIAVTALVAALWASCIMARKRMVRRRRASWWQQPVYVGVDRGGSAPRYAHPRHADSEVISIDGEESFGEIGSPGDFAGAYDESGTVGAGRRRRSRRSEGFREAASTIVARVLSGAKSQSPTSRVHL